MTTKASPAPTRADKFYSRLRSVEKLGLHMALLLEDAEDGLDMMHKTNQALTIELADARRLHFAEIVESTKENVRLQALVQELTAKLVPFLSAPADSTTAT